MSSKAYMADYMLRRYKRRRQEGIAALGGKCVKCGETQEDLLRFHHKDPTNKLFTLGKALAGWSEQRVQAELKKCELRCEECHKEIHAVVNEHGTAKRFDQGCRCEPCRVAYNARHTEWKRRTGWKRKSRRRIAAITSAL